MASVVLGPFGLEERVGKGGMGDVWRGRHLTQGTPVAVKVITPRWAREERYVEALFREVEASARLTHRGIVSVLDFGEIPFAAASATFGDFSEGSPYLVMEYVAGLPLPQRARSWSEARDIIARMLDALAHAHARSVIHRDIKPSNILLDAAGHPHITDFGLAHVIDERSQSTPAASASGTPRYMAPEQILGQSREQGPWTDLYALGCVAFGLVTGRAPFEGPVDEVLRSHLSEQPPSAGPTAPHGFDEWLATMLAKEPASRFRRAADALWALMRLGDVEGETLIEPFETEALPTLIHLTRSVFDLDTQQHVSTTEYQRPPSATMPRMAPALAFRPTPPPMPEAWEIEDPPIVPELIGVGLGIFGLRAIPLVGRRAERDIVWEELLEVSKRRRPRAVLLRGEAGTGKSRLSEWIGERAHELGAATLLRAVHSPLRGARDGLGPMIASALRLHGLSPAETYQRIRDFWLASGAEASEVYTCEALTQIVLGDDGAEGIPHVKFTSATQRWAAVAEFLARCAVERPVFLWLDDVQWGGEALGLCQYLLDRPDEGSGVLVLMTAREEGLLDRPAEAARLKQIAAHDACTTVQIRPLLEAHRMRLIRLLLGLDAAAAKQVAERTGGNPLFAVQLVGDWIDRGALELRADGFGLRADVELEVPDDIHALWQRRLEHLLHALPPRDGARAHGALEMAAALGQDIDEDEWLAMLGDGASSARRLVGALVAHRLAVRAPRGWAFAHGMLRESLEREARRAGRWLSLHARCAAVLDERLHPPEKWRRVAQHRLAAEAWVAALDPLRRSAVLCFDLGDYEEGQANLDLLESAANRAGLPLDDPWRAREWILRARMKRETVELQVAAEYLSRAEPIARRLGPSDVLAELLGTQASLSTLAGDLDRARGLIDESLATWQAIENPLGEAGAQRTRNWLLFWSGDYAGALAALEAAKGAYEAAGDEDGLGWVHYEQAAISLHMELYEAAADLTEIAASRFEKVGNFVALADCCNMRGELARARHDLPAAEAWYREALSIYGPVGHTNELIAKENLGMTLLAAGNARAAMAALENVLEVNQRLGRTPYILRVSAELVECASVLGDEEGSVRFHAIFEETRSKTSFADLDSAAGLERAGEAWAAQARPDLALRCWADADALWERLKREDRREQLRERSRRFAETGR